MGGFGMLISPPFQRLAGAGLVAAALLAGSACAPSGATTDGDRVTLGQAASTFPMVIVNNSGLADDTVYLTVRGRDGSQWYCYDATAKAMKAIGAKGTGYSFKLTALSPVAGQAHTFSYDQPKQGMVAGRVYVSFDAGLGIGPGTGLQDPDGANKWLDEYRMMWDFIELSFDDNLWINQTNVDQFALGLGLTVEKKSGSPFSFGLKDGTSRADVIATFKDRFKAGGDEHAFAGCLVEDTAKTKVYRVLSPQKAVIDSADLQSYLAGEVSTGWTYYKDHALEIAYDGFTYSKTAGDGTTLSFKCTGVPSGYTGKDETYTLGQPSSAVVWRIAGEPLQNEGSDTRKKLSALLGAALNRGVFRSYASWGVKDDYYKTGRSNAYSDVLHKAAANAYCYGFSYDDCYGTSSLVNIPASNLSKVTLTIPKQ